MDDEEVCTGRFDVVPGHQSSLKPTPVSTKEPSESCGESQFMAGANLEVTCAILAPDGKLCDKDNTTKVHAALSCPLALREVSLELLSSGKTRLEAAQGAVKFGNLAIHKAGRGFRLALTAQGVETAYTPPFTIVPARAAQLVVQGLPRRLVEGGSVDLTIAVQDSYGNVVGSDQSLQVVVSLEHPEMQHPPELRGGSGGGGGGLTATTEEGKATIHGLRLEKGRFPPPFGPSPALETDTMRTRLGAGELDPLQSYRLVFTGSGSMLETPIEFTTEPMQIVPRDAPRLEVTAQLPPHSKASGLMSLTCAVLGPDGQPDGTDTSTLVTATAHRADGSLEELGGAVVRKASNGVVAYRDLKINRQGEKFVVQLSAEGFASVMTKPFDVVPNLPSRLAVVHQPGSSANIFAIPVSFWFVTVIGSCSRRMCHYRGQDSCRHPSPRRLRAPLPSCGEPRWRVSPRGDGPCFALSRWRAIEQCLGRALGRGAQCPEL